jgi:hypothetical protein
VKSLRQKIEALHPCERVAIIWLAETWWLYLQGVRGVIRGDNYSELFRAGMQTWPDPTREYARPLMPNPRARRAQGNPFNIPGSTGHRPKPTE